MNGLSLRLALLALALTAAPASGQVLQVPTRSTPEFYISGGVGYHLVGAVDDGTTGSRWDFGSGAQYRASIEWGLGRGSSIGITGAHARMPLTYSALSGAGTAGCTRCDAHATVQSLWGSYRVGGGTGFHQVIDILAGVTRYSDFREDAGNQKLPPNGDTDFSFAVGYGFGYGLGNATELVLVQEYASALHQRENLPGSARTNIQQLTTRVGLRIGIGGGRP